MKIKTMIQQRNLSKERANPKRTPRLNLQPIAERNLAACARLYAAVFNRAPWKGKWTAKTAAKHIRECFQDPNFCGIVALEDAKPIGFAYGLVLQWENERHFYLKEMCVSTAVQGRGIGTRLLTQLSDKLRRDKVCQISLGTGKEAPARRFYERLGFQIDTQIILMNKRLERAVTR